MAGTSAGGGEPRPARRPLERTPALSVDLGGYLTQRLTVAKGADLAATPDRSSAGVLGTLERDDSRIFVGLTFAQEQALDLTEPADPHFGEVGLRLDHAVAWVEQELDDRLTVRAGRFATPLGTMNRRVFLPSRTAIVRPQMVRPAGGQTLFPTFLNGVRLRGKAFLGHDPADRLRVHAYFGLRGWDSDWNGGTRVEYRLGKTGLRIAANGSVGHRVAETSRPPEPTGLSVAPEESLQTNDYQTVGVDAVLDRGRLLWRTGVFKSFEADAPDREGLYTQPTWRFSREWRAFYRFDLLDAGQGLTRSTEHAVGVLFQPVPVLQLRAGYLLKRFDATDQTTGIAQASVTLRF